MGPYDTIADRIFLAARLALPYSVLVFLFFIGLVSSPYPFSAILDAPFFLMALYFWSVYRPTLIPPWLAFVAGLLMDLLSGGILGLNAMLFVLVRVAVVDQRRFILAQSFMMVWLGFALVNFIYHIAQWAIFSLIKWHIMPISQLWAGLLLGFAFFPIVSIVLHITHKILPPPVLQTKSVGSKRKSVSL